MNQIFKVAIDAMGGDFAPRVPVEGAVLAASHENTEVLLVGDVDKVQAELANYDSSGLSISVVPSKGKVEDHAPPALALRQKPEASILVATGLVKNGLADAVISMGSTGGTMAAAVITLGIIEGIERPAIGGPIIGSAPHQTILDLGSVSYTHLTLPTSDLV